jgi:ribosome-associated translation inhibitor RaiA
MITVQVRTDRRIPRRDLDAARRAIAHLDRYVDRPLLSARLTVRRTHAAQPYAVDATVLLDGRLLAAHATGRAATQAASEAAEALRRQVLRITGAAATRRKQPRFVGNGPPPPSYPGRGVSLKPPEQREIVPRRAYVDVPLATFDAIDELVALEVVFVLFRHVRTDEAVVVHHRDDGRLGLLFPPGSVLADEDDVVVPKPSRYDRPLALADAREEMDLVNHRFLYFGDADDDGRGKVLYLRRDGDYGLVHAA